MKGKLSREGAADINQMIIEELLADGVSPREILLIDCPTCGFSSYYNGGFTYGCLFCGEDIAQYSDDAYTLEDSYGMEPGEV